MTRQLRPRKGGTSYAAPVDYEIDEDSEAVEHRAGPSSAPLEVVTESAEVNQARRPKGKMYSLPTPSVHHRHRAVPLYPRVGRTERLTARPSLFEPPSLTLTTSCTERPKVCERVNKAWGFNVGYGPLWDLAEDRGWYKEAITTGTNPGTEAERRPQVYPDIRVQDGWKVMSLEYVPQHSAHSTILNHLRAACPYLPTDDITTEEGDLRPPPPVPCFFGPFKSQIRQDVEMFEAFPMCLYSTHMISFMLTSCFIAKYIPESQAHVFNAGAPVWGMDWCPIHANDRPGETALFLFPKMGLNRYSISKHDHISNILPSLLSPLILTAQILEQRLNGRRIRVYKYGLFRLHNRMFQERSLKPQILAK